jgi:hypothetical protein
MESFFLINVLELKHFGKFDQLFSLIHFFCLYTESKNLGSKRGDIILIVWFTCLFYMGEKLV